MFVVTVWFEAHPEHADSFREQMLIQASNSLEREAECRQFDVSFDPDNSASCFLYERYDDRKAFDVHLASEHFKQFDATVTPWIKSKKVEIWTQDN